MMGIVNAVKLGFLFALMLAVAVLTWWLTSDHYKARIAAMDKQRIEEVAKANAQAAAAVEAARAAGDAQVAAMQRAAARRQHTYNQIRKEVLRAKNGKACVTSAPMRALLDGLRGAQAPGAIPGGPPPRAGSPQNLLPSTGNAR